MVPSALDVERGEIQRDLARPGQQLIAQAVDDLCVHLLRGLRGRAAQEVIDAVLFDKVWAEEGLSQRLFRLFAGLIDHHSALSGLLATTVNSYDRLTPGGLAGYWANWAEDHRLVTTRTATGNPKSARLEHRMADCATNPYQAVAAVLQAARLGVEAKRPLPPAEDLDGLENVRATRHVPPSLDKALDALDRDKALRVAVGEAYCDALLYLKRDEGQRLTGRSVDEVRDFYLPFL